MIILIPLLCFIAVTLAGVYVYFLPIPKAELAQSLYVKPLTINLTWVPCIGFLLGGIYAISVATGEIGNIINHVLSITLATIFVGWLCVIFSFRHVLFPSHIKYLLSSHLIFGIGYLSVFWLIAGTYNA